MEAATINCPEHGTPVNEWDEFRPECFAELPGDNSKSGVLDDSARDPFFNDPRRIGVPAVIFWKEFQEGLVL